MPTATPTNLPLVDALGQGLKSLIMTYAVPAINADLQAVMVDGQGVPSGVVPVFGDVNVRLGDIDPVSETTICILPAVVQSPLSFPQRGCRYSYVSRITLKIPTVGDNAPEDFLLVGNSVRDHMGDLFSGPNQTEITPLNSLGQNILPSGLVFIEAKYTGCIGPTPVKPTSGAQAYRKWEMTHYCEIAYPLFRPSPLGG